MYFIDYIEDIFPWLSGAFEEDPDSVLDTPFY